MCVCAWIICIQICMYVILCMKLVFGKLIFEEFYSIRTCLSCHKLKEKNCAIPVKHKKFNQYYLLNSSNYLNTILSNILQIYSKYIFNKCALLSLILFLKRSYVSLYFSPPISLYCTFFAIPSFFLYLCLTITPLSRFSIQS